MHWTRYWFPTREHGYGWGPPTAWQGWCVLALYVVAIMAAGAFLPLRQMLAALVACTSLLVVVCQLKGASRRRFFEQ
jgi:hypothetical protein